MKKNIVLLLCIALLMLLPGAWAEDAAAASAAPVEIALLDSYPYEEDGEAYTYLALALKAPKQSRWSLRTKDGELIDTWIASCTIDSWLAESEDEKHCILLFEELQGAYSPSDLALSVTYTPEGGAETTGLFADWGESVAADARSAYGIHDFGCYIGFASDAAVFADANSGKIEIVMRNIPFAGQTDTGAYTDPASQFSFYTKDGTPLAEALEALGCSQFEISSRSIWIDLDFSMQECELSPAAVKNMIKESFGYIEYIRDDGQVIRMDIQMS